MRDGRPPCARDETQPCVDEWCGSPRSGLVPAFRPAQVGHTDPTLPEGAVKARSLLALVAAAALTLAVGTLWPRSPLPESAPVQQTVEQAPSRTLPRQSAAAHRLIVPDVVVRDLDGRVAWRGDVDLAPVLARIEADVRDPHRNDGGVFGNRERRLPEQRRGYYREYVIRTPGITHAGPQRLIIGAEGELYYTSDHYTTFRRIQQ